MIGTNAWFERMRWSKHWPMLHSPSLGFQLACSGESWPKARVASSASRRPSASTVERSRAFGSGSEVNTDAALAALSGCADGLGPGRANAAQ
jgi:hypothetical protein